MCCRMHMAWQLSRPCLLLGERMIKHSTCRIAVWFSGACISPRAIVYQGYRHNNGMANTSDLPVCSGTVARNLKDFNVRLLKCLAFHHGRLPLWSCCTNQIVYLNPNMDGRPRTPLCSQVLPPSNTTPFRNIWNLTRRLLCQHDGEKPLSLLSRHHQDDQYLTYDAYGYHLEVQELFTPGILELSLDHCIFTSCWQPLPQLYDPKSCCKRKAELPWHAHHSRKTCRKGPGSFPVKEFTSCCFKIGAVSYSPTCLSWVLHGAVACKI